MVQTTGNKLNTGNGTNTSNTQNLLVPFVRARSVCLVHSEYSVASEYTV